MIKDNLTCIFLIIIVRLLTSNNTLEAQEYEKYIRFYDFPIEYAFAVEENDKWGVIDSSGTLIVPIIYDNILQYGYFTKGSIKGQFHLINNEIVPIVKDTLTEAKIFGEYTPAPAGFCAPQVDVFIWTPWKGPLGRFASHCTAVSKQFIIVVGAQDDGIWTIEATDSPWDGIDPDTSISIQLVFSTYLGKRNMYPLAKSFNKTADKVLYKLWNLAKTKVINTKSIEHVKYEVSKNYKESETNEDYPGWIIRIYHPRYSFMYDYNIVSINPAACCCFYKWECRISK